MKKYFFLAFVAFTVAITGASFKEKHKSPFWGVNYDKIESDRWFIMEERETS